MKFEFMRQLDDSEKSSNFKAKCTVCEVACVRMTCGQLAASEAAAKRQ
jgi:hypothetical protein